MRIWTISWAISNAAITTIATFTTDATNAAFSSLTTIATIPTIAATNSKGLWLVQGVGGLAVPTMEGRFRSTVHGLCLREGIQVRSQRV